jgi:D-3-phosphoglycerate dehydrogenase
MKVLIADKFPDLGVRALAAAGCEVIVKPGLKGESLADTMRTLQCNVLVVRSTQVTADHLEASPRLQLVIRAGSGVDTIDLEAAGRLGVRVSNCPGQNSVAVAELTLGLMIALDRRIVDETDDLRRGVWNKKEYSKARGLKGRTLGIVGLGRIGYEVARRAKAFEMNVIYSDVVAHPQFECELGLRRVELRNLLAECDYLTLHVPGGTPTRHMIGEEELALLKPTAFVINCCRGGVVDEAALGRAVQRGDIAGAALDVYEAEPGASDTEFHDPVGKIPQVYGTHHVGASTEQAQNAIADEVVRIIRTFMETGHVRNCVSVSGVPTVMLSKA